MNDTYNFVTLGDVLRAISLLPEDDKKAYNAGMNELEVAARAFLHTRTNSELMDMADEEVTIDNDRVSLWDYMESFSEWYDEERDRRDWPIAEEVMKVVKEWGENWASDDDSVRQRFFAMEKQVRGMQKKIDRIAELLKDKQFTVTGEQALKM